MCDPKALGLTYISHLLGLFLHFLEKSEMLKSFARAVSAVRIFTTGLYAVHSWTQNSSPVSQFLNLNWKIKMLFEIQEEANDACRAVALQGIVS